MRHRIRELGRLVFSSPNHYAEAKRWHTVIHDRSREIRDVHIDMTRTQFVVHPTDTLQIDDNLFQATIRLRVNRRQRLWPDKAISVKSKICLEQLYRLDQSIIVRTGFQII